MNTRNQKWGEIMLCVEILSIHRSPIKRILYNAIHFLRCNL